MHWAVSGVWVLVLHVRIALRVWVCYALLGWGKGGYLLGGGRQGMVWGGSGG